MPDPAATPETLVAKLLDLKAQVAARVADIKATEAQLIALGEGKHAGADGRIITVVAATYGSPGWISYDLAKDDLERARELAGDEFPKLFDRSVIFTPCEGFQNVAPKLLTPAKARDIVALCTVKHKGASGKAAYCLYPK